MQVTIIKKASSKRDWYEQFNEIKAMSYGTPKTVEAVIDKEITLTSAQLAKFEGDLLNDSELIKENLDIMRVDENGIWHCISVTSANAKYRILVESEGYDYARYTAIVSK